MLDKDSEKYLSHFKEEDFSAYNFLCLFSAISYIKGEKKFDRDKLLSFIEINKMIKFYDELLYDIKIKNFSYSENLEDAYSTLKWADVLYTISPEEDSTIYISDKIPLDDIITLRPKYYHVMEEFVEQFMIFTKGNIRKLGKVTK